MSSASHSKVGGEVMALAKRAEENYSFEVKKNRMEIILKNKQTTKREVVLGM
jgi:hypothetical protein